MHLKFVYKNYFEWETALKKETPARGVFRLVKASKNYFFFLPLARSFPALLFSSLEAFGSFNVFASSDFDFSLAAITLIIKWKNGLVRTVIIQHEIQMRVLKNIKIATLSLPRFNILSVLSFNQIHFVSLKKNQKLFSDLNNKT